MSAADIGACCHRALLAEVCATPKPGLVDRANNGAHTDMNLELFQRSADSLRSYYTQVAAYGADTAAQPQPQAFAGMRPLGITAEQTMLAATGGVNTHKGAIFSLGLLAAAAGRLGALGQPLLPGALCACAASYAQGITGRELGKGAPATKGERAFLAHGDPGVRGEAEAGFPHALRHGLPAYREALREGASENDALVQALLHLLARMRDTNILTRCGPEAAAYASACAAAFLEKKYPAGSARWHAALAGMDRDFIQKNISPGGCADMVALCWLLHAMEALK